MPDVRAVPWARVVPVATPSATEWVRAQDWVSAWETVSATEWVVDEKDPYDTPWLTDFEVVSALETVSAVECVSAVEYVSDDDVVVDEKPEYVVDVETMSCAGVTVVPVDSPTLLDTECPTESPDDLVSPWLEPTVVVDESEEFHPVVLDVPSVNVLEPPRPKRVPIPGPAPS